MASILDYANPTRFLNFARIVLPWLGGLTLLLLVVGLYGAFTAPPDYQQGETVRIMYIHVPAAWLAIFAYVVMDGFDLGIGILFPTLEEGHERDTAMNSIAPVWDGNETWLIMGGVGLLVAVLVYLKDHRGAPAEPASSKKTATREAEVSAKGKLEVAEVPEPSLRPGGVLVRNTAALISLGTERSVVEFATSSKFHTS